MTDDLNKKENQGRISTWEKIGVDAIRADLEVANGKRIVGRHTKLAWEWVRSKNKPVTPNEEILMLEPNLYGLGFRLRPLTKKVKHFWGNVRNSLSLRK
jgi:hypothetical protein